MTEWGVVGVITALLQQIRDHFGGPVSISSGYRTAAAMQRPWTAGPGIRKRARANWHWSGQRKPASCREMYPAAYSRMNR